MFSCGRGIWRFLQHVTKDVHQLTEFVSRNQDKASLLLKKAPDKLSVLHSLVIACYFIHHSQMCRCVTREFFVG